jgi:hypothetical protein
VEEIAPRSSRHHPGKRAIQYSRDADDNAEEPRRTGSPACAGDDESLLDLL